MFHVLAQEVSPTIDTIGQVRLSAFVVTILVGTLIPIVVGLLTKATAPEWIKGVLNIVLTTATAAITQATMADGSAVISRQTIVLWFTALVSSAAAYYQAWKRIGVTNQPNADGVALLGATTGIGPSTRVNDPRIG